MGKINMRESQADRLIKALGKMPAPDSCSSVSLARKLKMPLPSVSKRVYDLRDEGFRIRSFQKFDKKRSRWVAYYYLAN